MPESALPSNPLDTPPSGAAKEKPMRGTVLCLEITLTVESDGTLTGSTPAPAIATTGDVPDAGSG